MSDSPPKQRSFLSAYGPLFAVGGLLLVILVVLFSMKPTDGSAVSPAPNASPPAMDPPQQTQAMQAEMVRVRRLVNSGKKTWDAVPPADQKVLDGVTKGKGKLMFEFGVQKMAEEAKMPKPPLGSTSTPSVTSTPPPFMKGK